MAASSLNHVFRLVWSERLGAFVAVAETRRGRGKGSGRNGRALRRALHGLALMLAGLATFGPALAGALPTGAQVVTGNASFAQTGSALTITQKSNLLATNWQSFNIGAGSSVTFVQPSQASVALNRVLGADVSTIQGALKANGQVFLLNPNGVLFTPTAQVNVGGLVASTLAISDADFAAGRFQFHAADSAVPGATVNNQGSLRAADGGTVALIAARVLNSGSIEATRGRALLAAADEVTLDLGASVPLRVTKGALDALVDNGGAIRADGGLVLLTAQARDQLSAAVINNSGVVRAQTLASGEKGEILLLGDMQSGQLNVGGHLDASAPQGGNGGHIETSAAWVNTRADLKVDAAASKGLGGDWLIDPYDYTIGPSAASTISSTLSGGTSVTVTTQANSSAYGSAGSSSGNGDITVSNAITKSGGGSATLTLQADRNIVVNAPITSNSGALNITLSAANNASGTLGGVNLSADLNSNGGTILIGGAGGSLTSAQSNGIGYALNSSASTPAVQIGTNVNILSGGGNITVNGQTNASTSSYEGSKGGIYVLSGATVNSGGGNLYMSGISTGAAKEFGFGVEAASGTTTTFMSSAASGGVVVDAQNTLNSLGALGLVNNGSQARVQFWAPNVAYLQFRINGSNQAATFTQSSPCHPGYPNCGTMVIPGGNQSYTSAGYNVVSMALQPIYVFTGNGSKTYDGTTDASNVALSSLGGPGGFTVSQLGALGFSTASKNAGSYTSLIGSASNPSSYSGGTYAVAYFNQGTYTINQKALNSFSAANKVYDGTTAAAVSASGIVVGDAVTVNATGGFASANVGNSISVNVTGVSLAGADAGNYNITGFSSISTSANITKAALTVTANNAAKTYNGSAWSGNSGVSISGFVNGETSTVLGGSLSYTGSAQGAVNAGSYAITPQGLSSGNYQISYGNGTLTVSPATLSLSANSASRLYGASNPAFSGTVTGFVGSDTLANATTGTLAFATPATATSNVGSYAINGSGLTANNGNYVFAQAAGNASALSITPATLTLAANSASRLYGAANPGFSGTVTGFVNGDTQASATTGTLTFSSPATTASNVGSYAINGSGLTANNGNYVFAQAAGNASALSVTPATLTVAANSASRLYGAANPSFSGTVTGFVGSDTLANATTGTLAFATPA
ncbi:filamentous hemagglutinin N-terminal domain-containing protein, partial [Pelomonas sp. CA6]|uniref:MBG domain-containing protein n=1 Tax=Pelomonas sp. CA6 TaxID=2907999 RepID=UPI001F4C2659